MLKQINGKRNLEQAHTTMGQAAWPVPFPSVLEYNSPAHGVWNIVHMGMLFPGSHQVYICADNCNRGVILTAAEMNAADRFSSIALHEEDLINGGMEDLLIDGISEILEKLDPKPSAMMIFTVCVHHFMGTDLDYVYAELERRHPTQRFIRCFMDPIMQKGGLTPDQKLRIAMYEPLQMAEKKKNQVSILANDLPTYEDCELLQILKGADYIVKDITGCKTYEEYLEMEQSFLNITCYPNAKFSGEYLKERLQMEHLYLPMTFDYDEIEQQISGLCEVLQIERPDSSAWRAVCEQEILKTRELVGTTAIMLDATAFPRLLSLTKLLFDHGFCVKRIYTDAFSGEEKKVYEVLQKEHPELEVYATIHPDMRVMPRTYPEKVLAIGQKAAYFSGTPYFVNVVENGGMHGYMGICHLMQLMREAFLKEKDTKDLVSRKGLGCDSCVAM